MVKYGRPKLRNFHSTSTEDGEELRHILDNAVLPSSRGGVVAEVLWEEAQAFFAGDKTADETAETIQSRVSLYLNEMK